MRKTGKNYTCSVCGSVFYRAACYLKRKRESFFCSLKCTGISNSRRTRSPSKLKKPAIGTNICMECSKQTPMFGTVRSIKQKFCSRYCMMVWRNKNTKINFPRGSAAYWWSGGTDLKKAIRTCVEYLNWRKTVFERDDYTCQECQTKGGRVNVDHIRPFSEIIKNIKTLDEARLCSELWDVSNGRVLCEKCHKRTPTYGFAFMWAKRKGICL